MSLWKAVVCGDQHALNSTHGYFEEGISLGGLPIYDKELERMLSYFTHRAESIIWSCGYPLMGWRGLKKFKKAPRSKWGCKSIDYLKLKIPRGFTSDDDWKILSDKDIQFLFNDWLGCVWTWMAMNKGNIIALPLAAYYFDRKLDLPYKAHEALVDTSVLRVDLSPLNEMKPEWWEKQRHILTVEGWNQIKPNVEAALRAHSSTVTI